jgi:hypothetical protein
MLPNITHSAAFLAIKTKVVAEIHVHNAGHNVIVEEENCHAVISDKL